MATKKIVKKFGAARHRSDVWSNFLAVEIGKNYSATITKIIATVNSNGIDNPSTQTMFYSRLLVIEGKVSELTVVEEHLNFDFIEVDGIPAISDNVLIDMNFQQGAPVNLDFAVPLRSANEKGLSVIIVPLYDSNNTQYFNTFMNLSVFGSESSEQGEIKAKFF